MAAALQFSLEQVDEAILAELSTAELCRIVDIARAEEERLAQRLFYHLYPDEDAIWTGPPLLGGLIEIGQFLHLNPKRLPTALGPLPTLTSLWLGYGLPRSGDVLLH